MFFPFPVITDLVTLSTPIAARRKVEEELRQLKMQESCCFVFNPNQINELDKAKTISLNPSYFIQLNFGERLATIKKLELDWDGYGAVPPSDNIVSKVLSFLNILPKSFAEYLDTEYIYPNPNGTITIEWRHQKNVVSIEFGEKTANFYSIINQEISGENNITDITSRLPSNLIKGLNQLIG
jgi:hypothetical protein